MIPEPSVLDFIDIYAKAIKGKKDDLADDHRGSTYEILGGVSTMLWSRVSQRDTDLFDATQFETCTDDELTDYAEKRYPEIPRILDTYGSGTATITRASTTAGAGTIWAGTYITLFDAITEAKQYVVVNDVPVSATDTSAILTIRADKVGPGSRATAVAGESAIVDPLWDNSWVVSKLVCDEGTSFEQADVFRARIRQTRKDNRVGYNTAIVKALQGIGAQNVAIFRPDYGGDGTDSTGINHIYVADARFSSSDTLVKSSKVLLESFRVLGDNSQVLGMQPVLLGVSLNVYLTDSPSSFDLQNLTKLIVDALSQYLGGATGGFTYKLDGIAGALYKASGAIQEVVVTSPSIDGNIITITSGVYNFPSTLSRYFLDTNNISIQFFPPR